MGDRDHTSRLGAGRSYVRGGLAPPDNTQIHLSSLRTARMTRAVPFYGLAIRCSGHPAQLGDRGLNSLCDPLSGEADLLMQELRSAMCDVTIGKPNAHDARAAEDA